MREAATVVIRPRHESSHIRVKYCQTVGARGRGYIGGGTCPELPSNILYIIFSVLVYESENITVTSPQAPSPPIQNYNSHCYG